MVELYACDKKIEILLGCMITPSHRRLFFANKINHLTTKSAVMSTPATDIPSY